MFRLQEEGKKYCEAKLQHTFTSNTTTDVGSSSVVSVCHTPSRRSIHSYIFEGRARRHDFYFISPRLYAPQDTAATTQYSRLHIHMWPVHTHRHITFNLMHDGIMFQHLHGRSIADTYIHDRIRFTSIHFNSGWTFFPSLSLVSMAIKCIIFFFFWFICTIHRQHVTTIYQNTHTKFALMACERNANSLR